ncbi:hypothetical protein DBR45_45740, partial [Pseudomonas sp. HMWF031]
KRIRVIMASTFLTTRSSVAELLLGTTVATDHFNILSAGSDGRGHRVRCRRSGEGQTLDAI